VRREMERKVGRGEEKRRRGEGEIVAMREREGEEREKKRGYRGHTLEMRSRWVDRKYLL
jgi:hypothetical protein